MVLTASPVVLAPPECSLLEQLARTTSEEHRLVQRARIVLGAARGLSNRSLAEQLGLTRKTVGLWRQRYLERRLAMPDASARDLLADATRLGAPGRIQPEQWVDLLALATTAPENVGVPITHWSGEALAGKAMETGLIETIDRSTVNRFLAECDLKPHRVEGWMNRKEDPEFDERATRVKDLLCEAVSPGFEEAHAVVSYDEKTGMQATERIAPDKPMRIGSPVKQEYEYKRHGTRALLAMLLVQTGQVLGALMASRTNEDTGFVLETLLSALFSEGYERVTIVLDQLNTHMSEEVVKVVANLRA
jgi:transposase